MTNQIAATSLLTSSRDTGRPNWSLNVRHKRTELELVETRPSRERDSRVRADRSKPPQLEAELGLTGCGRQGSGRGVYPY